MDRISRRVAMLLPFAAFPAVHGVASAQTADRPSTVIAREAALQAPSLIRLGSFVLQPAVEGALRYDDNIFAVSSDERDDIIFEADAEASLRSDFGRHALNARTYFERRFHATYGSQDVSEYGGGLDGRLDLGTDASLVARLGLDRVAEPRGSFSSFRLASEPVRYTATVAEATLTKRFSSVGLAGTARYASYDYDAAIVGADRISQNFRDVAIQEGILEATYALSGVTRFLFRGNLERRRYRLRPGDPGFDPITGLDRSADGRRLEIGAIREITSLLRATIRLGHLKYDYTDPRLRDLSNFSYFANVDWNVTPLTNLSISAERRIDETSSPFSAGNLRDELRVGAQHELLRTLLLGADVRHAWIDPTAGLPASRELEFGTGARYYFGRRFRLDAQFRHSQRSSPEPAITFNSNLFRIGLRYSL